MEEFGIKYGVKYRVIIQYLATKTKRSMGCGTPKSW